MRATGNMDDLRHHWQLVIRSLLLPVVVVLPVATGAARTALTTSRADPGG
jgi:hypothetical protein